MPSQWNDAQFRATSKAAQAPYHNWVKLDQADREAMKDLFMASGGFPAPTYPGLNAVDFAAKFAALDAYDPSTEPLADLHDGVIRSRRILLQLSQAAQQGDMLALREANTLLGLEPELRVSNGLIRNLTARASELPSYSFLADVPQAKGDSHLLPSEATVTSVREALAAVCETLHLPALPSKSEVWSAQFIAGLLEASFAASGMDDWSVQLSSTHSSITTVLLRKVYVPEDLKMSGIDAYAGIVRARVFAERYRRGKESGYYVLYNGTAASAWGGKAVAAVVDQVLRGTTNRYAGEAGYLACLLAAGLHDQGAKCFSEVYLAMSEYYLFTDLEARVLEPPVSCSDRAWDTTWSTFAGTDCSEDGGAYVGFNVRATIATARLWDALAVQPRLVEYFLLGGFDPSDVDDVTSLVEAGIIPSLV